MWEEGWIASALRTLRSGPAMELAFFLMLILACR